MTPKEKAEQLYDKFLQYVPAEEEFEHEYAKKCALIAVDQIIESRKEDGHFDDSLSVTGSEYYTPHPMYLNYWLHVKQEIEKL